MLRRTQLLSAFSFAALASLLPLTPASAESSTIRIEPRPYYGAVVTMEQGVRVWRPLPPTRMMIINPTGAPVHVNVADVHETVTHTGSGFGGGGAMPYAGYGGNTYRLPGYLYGGGARGIVRRGHGVRGLGAGHR